MKRDEEYIFVFFLSELMPPVMRSPSSCGPKCVVHRLVFVANPIAACWRYPGPGAHRQQLLPRSRRQAHSRQDQTLR